MAPEEIRLGTLHTKAKKNEQTEFEDLAAIVDIIEIVKLQAAQNMTKYQDETRR